MKHFEGQAAPTPSPVNTHKIKRVFGGGVFSEFEVNVK